jgi:hypothetical protein
MSGFTKLVPEIIQSSIWNESSDIRIVWITLLAIKDEHGYVRGDTFTIARMANVEPDVAELALKKFQEPDPLSHTPENEGRRIAKAPGGWIVLNHDLYRERNRTEYNREYKRRQRHREDGVDDVNNVKVDSTVPSVSVSSSVLGFRLLRSGERVPLCAYGEMKAVLITEPEYKLLVERNGEAKTRDAIEILDSYIASNGAKYKNHYAVLKQGGWVMSECEKRANFGRRPMAHRPENHI